MPCVVASPSVSRSVIHVYHERAEMLRDRVVRAAPDTDVIALTDRDQLRACIGQIRALFAPVPPRDGWSSAHSLRLIQILGVGADMLLPSPDLPARVEIAGVRGLFAPEVAEHVAMMMLALCRRLPEFLDMQRQRKFEQRPVDVVSGKHLVIVGMGEVGQRVARTASALGMRITGVCRRVRDVPHVDRVVGAQSLAQVLPTAEFLVVAAPRTPDTEGMLDAEAVALLPEGAFVINVARGGIVDEVALVERLRSGHIAGAALDVFEREPVIEDSPLWDAPNLIITPHSAGLGRGYISRCVDVLLENVRRLEGGEPRLHLVDRDLGY